MKILIVSDAWEPQVNGVVTTLKNTIKVLKRSHEVEVIHPGLFASIPCPAYSEIRLSLFPTRKLKRILREFNPDFVHIATEGPLGVAMRNLLRKRKERWSSSFHTKFAEYVGARVGFGENLAWKWMNRVYRDDSTILVTTESMKKELIDRGFNADRLIVWGRGVDETMFYKDPDKAKVNPPIFMNVGRVSVEKNLEAFYEMDLPGRKVQVGNGPMLETYKAKYPDVTFMGTRTGRDLRDSYREADVMVFPSKSDTFGLVMIEAMRCGTPVAAYPVTGPIDVITQGENGYMDNDLWVATLQCLDIFPESVEKSSRHFTWDAATKIFEAALVQRVCS